MAAITVTRTVDEFRTALRVLNGLKTYGLGDNRTPPEGVAGLNIAGKALLEAPGGRDLVASWAEVFDDTIKLVNKFNEDDLDRLPKPSDDDIAEVERAVLGAVEALVQRVNRLADRMHR